MDVGSSLKLIVLDRWMSYKHLCLDQKSNNPVMLFFLPSFTECGIDFSVAALLNVYPEEALL